MPTYEYACKQCGERLEMVQSFTDDALTICPACAGPLRKVFGSIGISFKGSGFYKNDSRTSGNGTKTEAKEGSTATAEKSSDAATPASTDTAKPAAKPETKAAAPTAAP